MAGFSNTGQATGYAGGANGSDGDLTGSYPSPIVRGLQTYPIDPRIPTNGETLIFNGGEWIPTPSPTTSSFTLIQPTIKYPTHTIFRKKNHIHTFFIFQKYSLGIQR